MSTSTAVQFYKDMQNKIDSAIQRLSPFRAIVHDIVDGKVQIQPLGSSVPLDEPYARLAGSVINDGDEVAVVYMSGKPFVLGRIQREAESGGGSGAILVELTNDNALAVANAGGTKVFVVDTNGISQANVMNGAFLRGYPTSDVSGNGVYSLDSSTGSVRFDGNMTVGGTINSLSTANLTPTHITSGIDATPTTASTTNTTSYFEQGSLSLALPTGTWTVTVQSWCRLAHSAGGSVSSRTAIATDVGTEFTGSAASTTMLFPSVHTRTGQSGTITIATQFKNNAAGTASAGACQFLVIANRTA